MVRSLRDLTGAGMMDCKKALASSNGNMEDAVDWLKKKGIKTAANQVSRLANEGLVGIKYDNNKITLIEINSETDFVARNKEFQQFVSAITNVAHNMDFGSIDILTFLDSSHTVSSSSARVKGNDILLDAISKIKENLVIRRIINIEVLPSECMSVYLHKQVGEEVSNNVKLASSICIVKATTSPAQNTNQILLASLYKLAMHAVAAKPQYLSLAHVPSDVQERETSIAREQTASEPVKANANIAKIIEGKVKKRLSELCLLHQSHMVEAGSPNIEKFIQSISAQINSKVTITDFALWTVGQNTSV